MTKKKQTKKVATKTIVKQSLKANSIRDFLWENMQAIKEGTVNAREANAITGSARAILQDQKQKIELVKLVGIKDKSVLKQIGMI